MSAVVITTSNQQGKLTSVAAAHGVGARESDDLLVIEAASQRRLPVTPAPLCLLPLSGCPCALLVHFAAIALIRRATHAHGGKSSPHAVEDEAQVVLCLSSIGQTAVGSDVVLEPVDAPGPPGHGGPARLLHGHDAAERPEVAVRDPGELFLDLLHVLARNVLYISTAPRSRGSAAGQAGRG